MPNAQVDQPPEERRNVELVTESMTIASNPRRAWADAVRHLDAPGNRLVAPTTFPGVGMLKGYADAHAVVMRAPDDLHFVAFDVVFASRGERGGLHPTVGGSHDQASRVEGSKLAEFIKEWDELAMGEQLG